MSNDLKNIYENHGRLHNFYDEQTPVDLFRGAKDDQKFPLMTPTLIGWVGRTPRPPDVLLADAKGSTPQYIGGSYPGPIAEEGHEKSITAKIVSDASSYIVKGCRTVKGHHRGVSVFDAARTFKGFTWYRIPVGTEIPPALAVTKDDDGSVKGAPIHFTIAPKDDMPLSLFLQHLKGFEAVAKKVGP